MIKIDLINFLKNISKHDKDKLNNFKTDKEQKYFLIDLINKHNKKNSGFKTNLKCDVLPCTITVTNTKK